MMAQMRILGALFLICTMKFATNIATATMYANESLSFDTRELEGECQGTINLALGGKATSSSHMGSATAAKAFQGPIQEWHSGLGVPQWIMYEFPSGKTICKVTFLPRRDNSLGNVPKDCPKSYKFEGSNDGKSFKTLVDIKNRKPCEPDNTFFTHSFPNEEAFKYYRLNILDVPGRGNRKFVLVRDMKFFGKEDIFPCTDRNLATGGTARASSVYSTATPDKGFGSSSTIWHSLHGMPQWISYTLPKPEAACSISFLPRLSKSNWKYDCPKTFEIYGIDSNNKEKLLKFVTNNEVVYREPIVVNLLNYEIFPTYKIKVLSVFGRRNGHKFVVISNIQIHGAKVCDPNPCNGATCSKLPVSISAYKCHCSNGFKGINCEINVAGFDCKQKPCKNGGTCSNKKCVCQPKYTGITCEQHICEHNECNIQGKQPLYRQDLRCGPNFMVDGQMSECDPNGDHYCCSSGGYCGSSKWHCGCKDCVDYRRKTSLGIYRGDNRCGNRFPLYGRPSICNPYSTSSCCSYWGRCGSSKSHCNCRGCKDNSIKKVAQPSLIRPDFRCGGNFLVDGKPSICGGVFPCCSDDGWCGNGYSHCNCITCTDYRKQKK